MGKLTKKQQERYDAANNKLPDGYYYAINDEAESPKYFSEKVWGVSVYNDTIDVGGPVGHVQKTGNDVTANTSCPDKEKQLVRLYLNRVAAALWHKQPLWSD